MSKTNVDTDELVVKGVRELLSEYQDGECPNVVIKMRKLGVHKDRLYRQMKDVGPRTVRKSINYKLLVVQKTSFL